VFTASAGAIEFGACAHTRMAGAWRWRRNPAAITRRRCGCPMNAGIIHRAASLSRTRQEAWDRDA